MSDMKAANRPVVDGAYALAIEMLDRGESPAAVEQRLVEMGLSEEAAKGIVASYSRATAQARSAGGKTEMLQGALVCGASLLVILFSSGSYVGVFGIILGGIQFFRGWRMRT